MNATPPFTIDRCGDRPDIIDANGQHLTLEQLAEAANTSAAHAAEVERLRNVLQGMVDDWNKCTQGRPPPDFDSSPGFFARRAEVALLKETS